MKIFQVPREVLTQSLFGTIKEVLTHFNGLKL